MGISQAGPCQFFMWFWQIFSAFLRKVNKFEKNNRVSEQVSEMFPQNAQVCAERVYEVVSGMLTQVAIARNPSIIRSLQSQPSGSTTLR